MTRSVELHDAFFWICDECGRDNFIRALPGELAEVSDLDFGCDAKEIDLSEWVMAPEGVVCGHCGSWFDVDFGED